jgi:hypothetical protein
MGLSLNIGSLFLKNWRIVVDTKIYKIEAISMFKMTYYIKAKSEEHALDEYCCELENDTFKEGSQKHIDEVCSDVRELTEEEFLKEFDRDNEYLQSWTKEQKLNMINVIDYEK